MDKVVIADITSLHRGSKGFGHFFHVADMLEKIFSIEKEVVVAGGPIYKTMYVNLFELKYDVDLNEFNTKLGKLRAKLKEIFNAICILSKCENDYVVFQDYSNTSLLIAITLCPKKNRVFLIQYKAEVESGINKILYKFSKRNIEGILCSKKESGEAYKLPYLCMPDYVYTKDDLPEKEGSYKYEFGVFGIIRKGKDVVGVARKFDGSQHSLIIAGAIQDAEMKSELEEISSKNENIVLMDKYLDNEEYISLIASTKYVILPYIDPYYNNSSSGVVFDVLFAGRPVITRDYEIFRFIKEYGIGFLYDELNDIDFDNLVSNDAYTEMKNNINIYINYNGSFKEKCRDFVLRGKT